MASAALPPGPGAAAALLPDRPARAYRTRIAIGLAVLLVGLLVFAWIDVDGSLSGFISGFIGSKGVFRSIVPQSLPPSSSAFWDGLKASVVTFSIALLSIVFGGVLSVAMLPLAARNLAPGRLVYELARAVQAVLRAIPELVMLLLFNLALGFTPFAAVIALTFHGIGVKGKLFAEAVEEMDMAPVEALRVAGAGRLQVFLHAVLPGVRNNLIGLTLYRLDGNFRSAVTLGAFGAGGIGFLINNAFNIFEFKVVATFLIIMVVWVLVIERLSTVLRARFT